MAARTLERRIKPLWRDFKRLLDEDPINALVAMSATYDSYRAIHTPKPETAAMLKSLIVDLEPFCMRKTGMSLKQLRREVATRSARVRNLKERSGL
jgi:hypothetical protein